MGVTGGVLWVLSVLSFRVVVIVIVLINGGRQQKSFCKISYKCQDMRTYIQLYAILKSYVCVTFCYCWYYDEFCFYQTKAKLVNTFIIVKSCWELNSYSTELNWGCALLCPDSLLCLVFYLPFIFLRQKKDCCLFGFVPGSCGLLNRFKCAFKWNKWAAFHDPLHTITFQSSHLTTLNGSWYFNHKTPSIQPAPQSVSFFTNCNGLIYQTDSLGAPPFARGAICSFLFWP